MNCRKHGIEVTGCSKNPCFPLLEDCKKCEPVTLSGGPVMEHESVSYWQGKLGIEPGMSKEEALQKFLEWSEGKKTCERCGGKEYFIFCPVKLVCREAMTLSEREGVETDGGVEDKSVDKRSEPGERSWGVQASFVPIP